MNKESFKSELMNYICGNKQKSNYSNSRSESDEIVFVPSEKYNKHKENKGNFSARRVSYGSSHPSPESYEDIPTTLFKKRKYRSNNIQIPSAENDGAMDRDELLILVKLLREKIRSLECDFKSEKLLSKKKDKYVVKLANEMRRRNSDKSLNNISIAQESVESSSCSEDFENSSNDSSHENNAQLQLKKKEELGIQLLQSQLDSGHNIRHNDGTVEIDSATNNDQMNFKLKFWRIVGVLTAIVLIPGIIFGDYLDLLSMNTICSPCMPGTVFTNSTPVGTLFEAPWWVPLRTYKSTVFERMCSHNSRPRTRIEWRLSNKAKHYNEGLVLIVTHIDKNEQANTKRRILLKRKTLNVRIHSHSLAFKNMGKIDKKKAPWAIISKYKGRRS